MFGSILSISTSDSIQIRCNNERLSSHHLRTTTGYGNLLFPIHSTLYFADFLPLNITLRLWATSANQLNLLYFIWRVGIGLKASEALLSFPSRLAGVRVAIKAGATPEPAADKRRMDQTLWLIQADNGRWCTRLVDAIELIINVLVIHQNDCCRSISRRCLKIRTR